jgi:hypothetical protein
LFLEPPFRIEDFNPKSIRSGKTFYTFLGKQFWTFVKNFSLLVFNKKVGICKIFDLSGIYSILSQLASIVLHLTPSSNALGGESRYGSL